MRRLILAVILLTSYTPSKALARDFLDLVCGDIETKDYCIVLMQGFVSGYQIGYANGTHNATAAPSDRGPELCVPYDLTSGEIYDDMRPHMPEGLGVLDMSLFIAALEAYPCDVSQD